MITQKARDTLIANLDLIDREVQNLSDVTPDELEYIEDLKLRVKDGSLTYIEAVDINEWAANYAARKEL